MSNEDHFHDNLVRSLHLAGFDTEQFTLEIYEFEHEGVTTYFNATALRLHCEKWPSQFKADLIQLTPELVEATQRKGLEHWKIARFTEWMMRNRGEKMRPILICKYPDDMHVCIDGAHRIATFAAIGAKTIPGIVVTPETWLQFAFPDMEKLTEHALSIFSDNLDS